MSATSTVGGCASSAPAPADFPRKLRQHREILAKVWSAKTIHPSYRPFQSIVPSRGQCGVSSAWLLSCLDRQQRLRAEYCYGDIIFHDGTSETINFHCWIEIGDASSAERMVVDLTCDQFSRLPDEPLYESHGSLMARLIEYKACKRMRFEELRHDAVWARFKALNRAARWGGLKRFSTFPRWRMRLDPGRDFPRESVVEVAGAQSSEAPAA